MLYRRGLLAWAIQCSVLLTGCSNLTPRDVVDGYLSAHNSHDIEAALTFYSDDVVFDIPGQATLRGVTAVRDLEAWDAALSSQLEMSDFELDGDTVVVNRIRETNQWFRLMGIEEVRYNSGTRITCQRGLITGIRAAELSSDSAAEITQALGKFLTWARAHHPERLDELMPEGRFVYTAGAAEKWIEILREWRKLEKAEDAT